MLHEQGDLQPSSVGCFLESIRDVPVPLKPCYLKYLGSVHNCWHQVALRLEEMGTAGETFASFQLHQKQVHVYLTLLFQPSLTVQIDLVPLVHYCLISSCLSTLFL